MSFTDMNRSIISGGRRYETEVKLLKGTEGGYVGSVWECDGTKRVHCTTVKYGPTVQDVNRQIDQFLISLQLK